MANITGRFVADFAPFTAAVEQAQITLKGLEADGGKVETALNRMVDNFSGRKLIQDANLMVAAIEAIGGVSQLTEKELKQVGDKAAEAAEKMRALGMHVPEQLQAVATAGTQTNSMFTNMVTDVGKMAASYFTAQAALDLLKGAFHLATDAAKAFLDVVMTGSEVASVADNFDRLATSAGLVGEELMGALREGTHNTITDFDLMKTATGVLAAGVNLTAAEFRTLASGAFALAQTGAMDVAEALTLMTNAMVTGKDKGLELRFGKIDLKKAEEDYAASLRTTSDNLNEEQKTQAGRIAIFQAVQAEIRRLGDQEDGLGDKVKQAQVAWQNFQHDLGVSVSTSAVVGAGLDALGATILDAFGGSRQDVIKGITKLTEDFTIALIDAGKYGVEVAGQIAREWLEGKLVFTGVVQGLDLIYLGLKEVSLAATEMWEKVTPGSSGTADITRLAAEIKNVQQRMIERSDQMDRDKALHAEINTVTAEWTTRLTAVQQAMIAARDTQATATATTTGHTGAITAHTSALTANTAATGMSEAAKKSVATADEKALKDLNTLADLHRAAAEALRPAIDRTAEYDTEMVKMVTTLNEAGFSAEQLAKMYGGTVTAMKEMIGIGKAHRESLEITAALERDFTTRAIQQSGSRTDAEIADINASTDAYIEHLKKENTYTDAIGTQIEAIRKQKIIGATTDWDVIDEHSKKTLDEMALRARSTYEQMLTHQDDFTYAVLDQFEDAALAAEDAAARWSQSMDTAADSVIASSGRAADEHAANAQRAAMSWSEAMDAVAAGQGTLSGQIQTGPGTRADWGSAQHQSEIQQQFDAGRYFGPSVGGLGPDFEALGMTPVSNALTQRLLGRASGGPVSAGQPYVVGERGPELFLPTQSGSILPNGSGGGVTQNIVFHVNGTGEQVARVVSEELTRMMRVGRKWPAV